MSYTSSAASFARSRDRQARSELAELFEGIDVVNTSVLDIGCGAGHLIAFLENKDWSGKYLWIDTSAELLEEAKKRFPEHQFAEGNMLDYHSEKTYDLIALIASLHHLETIEERIECLGNLKRSAHWETQLLMTNWRLHDINIRPKKWVTEIARNDFIVKLGSEERFYHAFEEDELSELLRVTGWNIEKQWHDATNRNLLTIASPL